MGKRPGWAGRNRRKAGFSTLAAVFIMAAALFAADRLGLLEAFPTGETVPVSAGFPVAAEGKAQVFFFDVGQGDSELIRIPDGPGYFNVLLDTGEAEYADGLTAYLQSLGVEKIDVLVESHPHSDHMGCMARIVERFEIGSVYMPLLPEAQTPSTRAYESLLDAILDKGLTARQLYAGSSLECPGNGAFQVLAPRKGEEWEDVNNYSAVLRFTYGDTVFLFTGDAEKQSEADILEDGYDVSADVLKCGHHGSSTSTSQAFLRAVNPRWAVISCGEGNSYGHPHSETIEKLGRQGAAVLRTDEEGTVLFASDGETLTAYTGLGPVPPKE